MQKIAKEKQIKAQKVKDLWNNICKSSKKKTGAKS